MSFDDEITAGFEEMNDFAGESFAICNRGGIFTGVFRGDSSDVGFSELQGYDTNITNAVSVAKSLFTGLPPAIDEIVTKPGGEKYNITAVESLDGATWDLSLKKING